MCVCVCVCVAVCVTSGECVYMRFIDTVFLLVLTSELKSGILALDFSTRGDSEVWRLGGSDNYWV